jgi:hypothetical protein
MMLKEYDVVRLTIVPVSILLQAGAEGTVLIVYESKPPKCEVEFMGRDGQSLGTFTVGEENLELLMRPET